MKKRGVFKNHEKVTKGVQKISVGSVCVMEKIHFLVNRGSLSLHVAAPGVRCGNCLFRHFLGNWLAVKELAQYARIPSWIRTDFNTMHTMLYADSIAFQSCLEDYVSPIKLFVNLSLESDGEPNPKPVLNPLSNRTMAQVKREEQNFRFLERW